MLGLTWQSEAEAPKGDINTPSPNQEPSNPELKFRIPKPNGSRWPPQASKAEFPSPQGHDPRFRTHADLSVHEVAYCIAFFSHIHLTGCISVCFYNIAFIFTGKSTFREGLGVPMGLLGKPQTRFLLGV